MDKQIICEKCGAIMAPIDPDKPVGMECPDCGWGWATTYTDPKHEDETVYKIILEPGNETDKDTLKAISQILNCNYLKARDVIADFGETLVEGKASEIEGCIKTLLQASIKYRVEPEWPY